MDSNFCIYLSILLSIRGVLILQVLGVSKMFARIFPFFRIFFRHTLGKMQFNSIKIENARELLEFKHPIRSREVSVGMMHLCYLYMSD